MKRFLKFLLPLSLLPLTLFCCYFFFFNDKKEDINPLFSAAEKGDIPMVDHLIKTGECSLNNETNAGYTLLDLIYDKMKETNSSAKWEKYNTLWELIIQHGGKFNKNVSWFSNVPPNKPTCPKK